MWILPGGRFIIRTGSTAPAVVTNPPYLLDANPSMFNVPNSGTILNVPLPNDGNQYRLLLVCVNMCAEYVGPNILSMTYGGVGLRVHELPRTPLATILSGPDVTVNTGISYVGVLYLGSTIPANNQLNISWSGLTYPHSVRLQPFVLGNVDSIDGQGYFRYGNTFSAGSFATVAVGSMPVGTTLFSFGTTSVAPAQDVTFVYGPPATATVIPSTFTGDALVVTIPTKQEYAGSVAFKTVTTVEAGGTNSTWTKTGVADPAFSKQNPGVSNITMAFRPIGQATPIQFWTRIDNGTIPHEIRDLVRVGSRFIAGTSNKLYRSDDLNVWFETTHPSFTSLTKLVVGRWYNNDIQDDVPACLAITNDPTNKLLFSTDDGLTWTDITPSGTGAIQFLDGIYEPNTSTWMVVGTHGSIYYSFNPVNPWTQGTFNGPPPTVSAQKITYSHPLSRWFVLAAGGQIWHTTDPFNPWTIAVLGATHDVFLQSTTLPTHIAGERTIVFLGRKSDGTLNGSIGTMIYRWNPDTNMFNDISGGPGYIPNVAYYDYSGVAQFVNNAIVGPDILGTTNVTNITGTAPPYTFTSYPISDLTTLRNIIGIGSDGYVVGNTIIGTGNGTTYTTELLPTPGITTMFNNVIAHGLRRIAYGSVTSATGTTGAVYTRLE